MNDISVVKMITERKDISNDARQEYMDRAVEDSQFYDNYIDETTHPYISNISLPWPYIIIESYLGKCIQAMAAQLPYVRIVEEDDDSRPKAKRVEKDVNMVFYRQKWPIFAYNLYKQVFKFGTAFVFMKPWGNVAGIEMPVFEHWNFFKVWENPNVMTLEDEDAYIIYETFLPLRSFRKFAGNPNYKNLDKIEPFDSMEMDEPEEKQIKTYKQIPDVRFDPYSKLVKTWIYISKEDFYIVTNETNVIRNKVNPWGSINVKVVKAIPIEDELRGMSILQQGKGLFTECSENRNQYNDAVNLMLNPQYIINRDAGVKKTTIVNRPGNVLYTDDVNAVIPMKQDYNILQAQIQRGSMIETDIQNYSNAFPGMRGQPGQTQGTATGDMLLQNAGELRSNTYNMLLSMCSLEDMAKDIVKFKQMMMTDPSSFYYWPEQQTEQVSPEDYYGNFTYKTISSFKQAREIERKQLIEAMTFIFGNQAFLPRVIPRADEWLSRLLDYFDLRNPEQLWVTEEEAMMNQMVQMMAGQGMMGLGGNGQQPALGEKEMRMGDIGPNPMTTPMISNQMMPRG